MRGCLSKVAMIVTLWIYVIFPLIRYLSRRPTVLQKPQKKGCPPVIVNGSAMFGGGTVMFKSIVQSPTTEVEQQHGPSRTPEEETKKPNLYMGDAVNLIIDKEPAMALLHEYRQLDAVSTMTKAHFVVGGENKWEMLESEQDGVPCQTGSEINIHQDMQPGKEKMQERSVDAAVDVDLQQALREQFKCLEIENSTQKSTCMKIQALSAPSESNTLWNIARLAEEHTKIKAMKLAATEEVEVWDEYVLPTDDKHGGATSSKWIVPSLLSNTSINLGLNGDSKKPSIWHFPAEPDLAEEVPCPLLRLPDVSYYPPIEPITQFEVIWRAWESLDEDVGAVEPIGGPFPSTKTTLDFTVMSYNILAQDLIELNQELYTHCPLEVLDWKYRCCLFLNDLKKWSPDILCLQEVQQNHYYEELHPVLAQMGYTCIYKQRTGTKTDGCAICYKSRHFTEITVKLLEFFQPETELLNRHNVGIVLLLRPVATLASEAKACGPPLCVANTHLLFNPRRGDVKLAQLAIVIAEIDCLIKSCRAKREHCNVILCGDFNSVPNSPLYQLITVGELYYHGMQAWMVSGQKDFSHQTPCHRLFAPLWPSSLGITDHCQYTPVQEDQESPRSGKYQYSHDLMLKRRFYPAACVRPLDLPLIPGVTDHTADLSRKSLSHTESFRKALYHRLDLKSVYEHVLPGSGKPEVTTLNSDVGATVDYIFYSPKRTSGRKLKDGGECASNGLKLMGRLSLLSEEVLWSMNGLPNHVFPSDHLSLLAQFQMQLHPA